MKRINKFMRHSLIAIMLAGSLLSIAGCHTKREIYIPPPPPPTIGQIRAAYVAKLKARDVQVIHLGETVRLVLLSADLFAPGSPNVKQDAWRTLGITAHFLKTFDKATVKVSGYTDNRGWQKRQQALSTRQAQVVASYLWTKGIDTRLVYAKGYNGKNPVAWNGNELGRIQNRRVEISFHYYPHYIPYN